MNQYLYFKLYKKCAPDGFICSSFIFYKHSIMYQSTRTNSKLFYQASFKKCYKSDTVPHYSERLKSVNLPTLESVCIRNDLNTLFKIITKLIDVLFAPVFCIHKQSRLIYRSAVSKTYRNSFYHRQSFIIEQILLP